MSFWAKVDQAVNTGGVGEKPQTFDWNEIDRRYAQDPGGAKDAFVEGAKRTGQAIRTAFNVYSGDDKAAIASATKGNEIQSTLAQEDFHKAIMANVEDPDSWWSNITGVGQAILQQPKGAWHEMLAQLPNSGPPLVAAFAAGKVGAKIGATIGTSTGPVGTVVGGITGGILGMFLGTISLETGFKAQEDLAEGKEYDRIDVMKRGAKKGSVIGGIDSAMMLLSGGIAHTLLKPAAKASNEAIAATLKAMNINPLDDAAIKAVPGLPAKLAQIGKEAAKPFMPDAKTVTALAAAGVAGEMVSEGAGDYLGEVWAEGEGNKTDAILEGAMGGLQGAVHTSVGAAGGRALAKAQTAMQGKDAGAKTDLLAPKPAIDPATWEQDRLTVEAKGTREQSFDPATFSPSTPEDWAMALGQPVPGSTDERIAEMRQANDIRMRNDLNIQDTAENWQDRTVQIPETDEAAWERYGSREESVKALEERNRQIKETGYRPFAALGEQLFAAMGKQATAEKPAHEVDPEQVNTEPTEGQKAAGNYKKEHITIDGLGISIENPAGSTRKGKDKAGKAWETEVQSHYGYFKRSEGKDGDQVDVFVKPGTATSPKVFVVDQVDPDTGQFDEHKVVLGAETEQEARDIYKANYQEGWQGLGAVTEMNQAGFKEWLKDGTRTKQPAGNLSTKNEDGPQTLKTRTPEQQSIIDRVDRAINQRARGNVFAELGRDAVPGLRLQEHEEAGQWVYQIAKGEATQEEFDAQIEEWRQENRIRAMGAPEPKAAPTPEPDSTNVNTDFIDKRVQELGSVAAVDKEYSNEDKVSQYARWKARQTFGETEQTKQDKLKAIDKFFAGDNKAGLQKKLTELKQARDQFKDDPEFLKQIDARIAEIEQSITPTEGNKTDFQPGQTSKAGKFPQLKPGQTVTWQDKAGDTHTGKLVKRKDDNDKWWWVERETGTRTLMPENRLTLVEKQETHDGKDIEIEGGIVSVDMPAAEANQLTPKEQKKYLLDEIDAAIEAAPDIRPDLERLNPSSDLIGAKATANNLAKVGSVTIEVPGDGEFNILNTKTALRKFKARAKQFPDTEFQQTSPMKSGPSTKPMNTRITGFAGDYIREYTPKRSTKTPDPVSGKFYKGDGWFSNGVSVVKGVPKNISSQFPVVEFPEAALDKLIAAAETETYPVSSITEVYESPDTDPDLETLSAIVIAEGAPQNRNAANFDPRMIDFVKRFYPDAEMVIRFSESRGATAGTLYFLEKGAVVGAVMGKYIRQESDTIVKKALDSRNQIGKKAVRDSADGIDEAVRQAKVREQDKAIPDGWKRVPGGGLVSEFGDGRYLISGESGAYRLSDESSGTLIGGTFTNTKTAAARGNQHWIESQRKEEKPAPEIISDPETNMQAEIIRLTSGELAGKYSVVVRDLDSGETTGDARIFDSLQAAREHANTVKSPAAAETKPEYGATNKLFTQDAAEKARALIRSKLNQLSSGVDPELMQAGITMAGYHIEAGARSFAAYSKAMIKDFGEAIKPYLRSFYEGVRYYPGLDTTGMTNPQEIDAAPAETTGDVTPEEFAYNHFKSGKGFQNITDARKTIGDATGQQFAAGSIEAKQLDEQIELAAVKLAREIVASGKSDAVIFDELTDLQERMPNLSVRTSTSIQNQAYSTPLPMAFVAGRLAGIDAKTTVFEPSGGNGALLITANPSKVHVNELDAARVEALNSQDFAEVTQGDGTQVKPGQPVDVVIANPPFGTVKNDAGESKVWRINPQYDTTQIDHAMVFNALKGMKEGGRAVFIIGSVKDQNTTERGRQLLYRNPEKVRFFKTLQDNYNVVDHFSVSGKMYSKQGASWPVDIIVIDGKGKSDRALPGVTPPALLTSFEQLKEKLNENTGVGTNEPGRSGDVRRGDLDTAKSGGEKSGSAIPSGLQNPSSGRTGTGRKPGEQSGGTGTTPGGKGSPSKRDGSDKRPSTIRDADDRGKSPAERDVKPDDDTGSSADKAPDSGRTESQGDSGERQSGKLGGKPDRSVDKELSDSDSQVTYVPASKSSAIGTLTPINMSTAMKKALAKMVESHGDLDQFVADRLGYSVEEIIGKDGEFGYFSGEQVDAIALGIENIDSGAGFIIGDQTGVGKGRVVAAMIRYAMRQGITPIFVTEKPNLYADMYRDLSDIGMADMADKILMTNRDEKLFLTEDGSVELRTKANHNTVLRNAAMAQEVPDPFKVVFTTYDQTNKADSPRRDFLRSIIRNSMLIMDEAHNAGGTEGAKIQADKYPRSIFFRELVRDAHAVFYSSATYAKRPGTMDLYAKTDMRLAVDDVADLGAAIEAGGVPLQQSVAAMLTEAGQYVRRERTFEGIEYATRTVPVDRSVSEHAATAFAAIKKFSDDYIETAISDIDDDQAGGGYTTTDGSAAKDSQIQSTSFTSVMHNLVNQMLLSMKTVGAINEAIDVFKNQGKKPVITLSNTMGSFIQSYAEKFELKPGDHIGLRFNDLIFEYLDKTRYYTVGDPFSKNKERHYITDEELGPAGVAEFNRIRDMIQALNLGELPVSPVDYIRFKLEEAGLTVAEITGRDHRVDYRADGTQRYARRGSDEKDIKARTSTIYNFNTDNLDALVINRSGSTGLSLHALPKFDGHKPAPRHMIVLQAEGNIDTHMQMLGRVNRAGQVVAPSYSQLVGDTPAEMRPAAVLAAKMASLNANTTADTDSAVTAKGVTNFMNKYGDQVTARIMTEYPEWHKALGEPLQDGKDGLEPEGAARKVTGKIPMLPLKDQEQLYSLIEDEYNTLIDQLNATGENDLEARTFDTDARVLKTAEVAKRTGPSPFQGKAEALLVDMKKLGKSYTGEQVKQVLVEKVYGGKKEATLQEAITKGKNDTAEKIQAALKDFDEYVADRVDDIEDPQRRIALETKLDGNRADFSMIASELYPGRTVNLVIGEEEYFATVTEVKQTGSPKNPLAMGTWKATFAIADSMRRITYSFLNLSKPDVMYPVGVLAERDLARYDNASQDAREERTIITGNLLAAYGMFKQGRIINFTDHKGDVKQGILMPRKFNLDTANKERPVVLNDVDSAMTVMEAGRLLKTRDDLVISKVPNQDRWAVSAPAARSRGSKYYLNSKILEIVGADFVRTSNRMRAFVEGKERLRRLASYLINDMGETLRNTHEADAVRSLLGIETQRMAEVGRQTGRQQQAPQADERAQARPTTRGRNDFYALLVGGPEKVDGTPVVIPGYEGFRFFVYKNTSDYQVSPSDRWSVSEYTTGLSLGKSATREGAIETAEINLRRGAPKPEDLHRIIGQAKSIDDLLSGADKKLQTSADYTPGQGISLKDIQSRFKGQQIFLSPDGSIAVRMQNGMGLVVRWVKKFSETDTRMAIDRGRMDDQGQILGSYSSMEISLNRDLADTITRDHELYHFLAELLLTKGERLAIRSKALAYRKNKTFKFEWRSSMEENEANAFAQLLNERENQRDTLLGRAIQKVLDFFDGILHIGRASARKIARQVESGKIFGRQPAAGQGAGQQRFMFAGPEARGADKGMVFEAQQMRDSGASREEVWKKTGWWEIVPGSDVWSFEIDDSIVSLTGIRQDPGDNAAYAYSSVGDLVQADALFEAYPWLKDIDVIMTIKEGMESNGKFKPFEDRSNDGLFDIQPEIVVSAPNKEQAKSVLLHEIQHAIQAYEGFASGGNMRQGWNLEGRNALLPLRKSPKIQNIYKEADRLHEQGKTEEALKLYEVAELQTRFMGYQSLTGEAQARLTQRRLDMTPAQRKLIPPWQTLEKMMREEGLLQPGQKPEDVLISRFDTVPSYHVDPDYRPKKTITAYKLMRFKKTKPGQLFPLFIGKNKAATFGEWNIAEFIPTKGFQDRPGWHAGHLPIAPHLRTKKGKKAADRLWVEVEMPADRDWQKIADASKGKDIRNEIPKDGYYKFRVSKMQGGAWIIGGAAKFNRVLSDAEVAQILKDAGYPDAEIQAEMHGSDPKFSTTSDRVIAEKFETKTTTREKVADIIDRAKSKEERQLALDRFLTKSLDNLHFIKKRLGDEAYKMHRMLTGITSSTFTAWLKHGKLFVNGKTFGVKGHKEGPLAFFESLGEQDSMDLLYWVAAKRAEVLEAEGRENWLDKDARQAIFDRVGDRATTGETWAALNLKLQKYNTNILDIAEAAGLIDPEGRAEWESSFYVPFYRIMEDPETYENFMAGPRKNRQHISAQIRRLRGGENKISDPMESLFRNWMFLLDASARNMARAKAFEVGQQIGMIEEVQTKELLNILGNQTTLRWAVKKEGAARAAKIFDSKEQAEEWVNDHKGYEIETRKETRVFFGRMKDFGLLSFQQKGEPVYFRTLDPDLFEALSEVDTTSFNNVFMKMMGAAKRWLSYGVTFGPAFRLRNLIRDTVHVSVVSKSFAPFLDSARGFVKAMKEDADFREYTATGFAFGSSYIHTDDPGHAGKALKRLIKQEGDGVVDRILDTPRKMMRVWEKIGEAGENAARLGLYTNLRKQGLDPFEAGFQARDLMDFSMRGSSQTVQILTRIVPFLNARMQGLYKLGRSAHDTPGLFLLRAGLYTVAALALWSLFKDDDRYKELQDFDKWTYHHFWLGDDHYRIPKPFEIGALFGSMPETVANVMNGTEEGKHVFDWFKFTLHDVFNVDMPQLFKPVIEERFNLSTFRGQRVVPDHMVNLKPSEQYREYTSETMRAVGKALNISPIKLEHYVNGYFSTLGMMVVSSADVVTRAAGDYPARPTGGPNPFGLGVLNRKFSSNKYVDRFYDYYEEVDSAYRTLQHLAKTEQPEAAMEFLKDNAALISMRTPTNKIRAHLAQVNEEIKKVRRDKTMTAREKAQYIDFLNQRKKDVAKAMFEKIRAR